MRSQDGRPICNHSKGGKVAGTFEASYHFLEKEPAFFHSYSPGKFSGAFLSLIRILQTYIHREEPQVAVFHIFSYALNLLK